MLADPAGVPFSLRQAGQNDGVELANEPNCWAMSSLHTPDVGQAQAFYGAMFEGELKSLPDVPFSLWLRSGRVVAAVTATDAVEVPPHWSVNWLFKVPGEWSAEMIAHAAIRAALLKRIRDL